MVTSCLICEPPGGGCPTQNSDLDPNPNPDPGGSPNAHPSKTLGQSAEQCLVRRCLRVNIHVGLLAAPSTSVTLHTIFKQLVGSDRSASFKDDY